MELQLIQRYINLGPSIYFWACSILPRSKASLTKHKLSLVSQKQSYLTNSVLLKGEDERIPWRGEYFFRVSFSCFPTFFNHIL